MSYEDLREHDIFLPESEWGSLDLHSSVNLPALIATFVLGATSCIFMAAGNGRLITWIGSGLFILFMFSFAFVSNAGIERQHRRIAALSESSNRGRDSGRPAAPEDKRRDRS